jgi:predicted unusual protein kinase regulating ubiquinone biosynthesis (AarF/ABC1/UbiB family)
MQSLFSLPLRFFNWLKIGLAVRRLKKLPVKERQQAHQALAVLLGNARGMPMKIGQLMAGGELKSAYQPLVTNISPLPLTQILPTWQKEFSQPLDTLFTEIHESQAAASLGQVHYARLKNDDEVAVKVRYPGMVDTLTAELKLTAWLPSAGPFKRWHFNSADYKQTLQRQLLREIDYRIEAQTQQRFRENLTVSGLIIPKIYPELTRSSVLVQSFETGCRLDEAVQWDKKHRLEIARTLLVTLLQSLFLHGEIHADPHSGNYLFRINSENQAETVLLDYGCTVLITQSRRLALLKLIDAYINGLPVNPLQCFAAMGFDGQKLLHIEDKIDALCELLFLPFRQSKAFSVETWQLSAALQNLLAEQRWWFRAAGPADLLFLIRAFHGLVQQLETLQAALPWGGLLKFSVGEALLEQARHFVLPEMNLTQHKPLLIVKARKLCVQVYENQHLTISLDLPAEAALELESLIPATVLVEIKNSAEIDLDCIISNLEKKGIVPQVVFETNFVVENTHKRYKVWLE